MTQAVNKELVNRLIEYYKVTPTPSWSDFHCVRGVLTMWGVINSTDGQWYTGGALGMDSDEAWSLVYTGPSDGSPEERSAQVVAALTIFKETGHFMWPIMGEVA